MAWKVCTDLDADRWHTTADLTLEELQAVEESTGESWYAINPFRSAKVAAALLGVFLAREGKTDEESQGIVAGLKARQLAKSFELIDDDEDLPDSYQDGLPNPAGGHSTRGSSGPRKGSAGRRT